MRKKLAIIGASIGQLALVKKAIEMGIETHCFAWDKDAICKEYADYFYPISIFDTEEIICKCREIGIDGVISNASEETSLVVAKISEALKLVGTPSADIMNIQNKKVVRNLTVNTSGLNQPIIYSSVKDIRFPCVVKPVRGSAKRGVSYCHDKKELQDALRYARNINNDIFAEEFIAGKEYSVECLSYRGIHHVIQITDKITTGYPHFVELEHHQPAQIESDLRCKIHQVISNILNDVKFTNGASHIEIKIMNDKIYLIEINPRGGGDRISDTLIHLSTTCDYIQDMILIALDSYVFHEVKDISYSGIIYLCKQNRGRESFFYSELKEWMVEREYNGEVLIDSISNYDRNGHIIYKNLTGAI